MSEADDNKAIATRHSVATDGFAGFEDRAEGVDGEVLGGGSLIKGMLIKFSNEAAWIDTNGEELPAGLELVVVDIIRAVVKFVDQQLVDKRVLAPGEFFPDLSALNDTTPKEEWSEGPDGKPRGPWQKQHILYLLNLDTMDRFSYPTSTVGGSIAIRELVDKTNWMRKLRGPDLYPRITLGDVFMNTKFGGRQRPHFEIKGWVQLGSSEPVAVSPTPKSLPGVKEVAEPTLAKHMQDSLPPWNDELGDLLDGPAKSAAAATPAQKPALAKPQTTRKGVQKIAGARR
jgi:hypothetical protein